MYRIKYMYLDLDQELWTVLNSDITDPLEKILVQVFQEDYHPYHNVEKCLEVELSK